MSKESKKHTPALPNADTRRGGKNPSCAGLTSCTSPEVQSNHAANSHTGVSSDCVHKEYLQPIITQYFIDNKSEIWLLFLIAHSKR